MMNKKYIVWIVLAVASPMTMGCSDDSDEHRAVGCSSDYCYDTRTLVKCDAATGNKTFETCDGGCSSGKCQDAPAKCTSNMCVDAKTLLKCDTVTGKTTVQKCSEVCTNGQCIEASVKCTGDACLDPNTLAKCNQLTGKTTVEVCPNGCESNACRSLPEVKCSYDVCFDANTLLKCDTSTGKTNAEPCPNGCDAGKCLESKKCTQDVCHDNNTLLKCDISTGQTSAEPCPNGCDAGKCQDAPDDKCKKDVCQDGNTLLKCDKSTGQTSTEPCPNGCDAGKCQDAPDDKCKEDACQDGNTLLKCDKSTGKTSAEPCPNGCDAGKCLEETKCTSDVCQDKSSLLKCDKSTGKTSKVECSDGYCSEGKCVDVLGKSCQTESSPFCVGNALIYCAETSDGPVWVRLDCPQGYQCAAYDSETMCLEKCTKTGQKSSACGSGFQVDTICKQTDAGMFYIRDDNSLFQCEYGCADNKTCVKDGNCTEKCLGADRGVICSLDGYASDLLCGSGKSCYLKADGTAACGYTCTPDTALKQRCYYQYPDNPESGQSSYAKVECREGVKGSYGYAIVSYESCSGGCSDEKGCEP